MSNVESLLSAILTRDAQYIVVPQSRVEELLLAIYNSGGGGGGGEGGVDEFARAELLKKVDKRDGYALISTSEIERLAGVSNYDDTAIRGLIDNKVTAKNGFSLIDDTDYANFKNLKNYDDTAIKALIDAKVDDTVTVAGLKITTNITANQLANALDLSTYVKKDGSKVLSTNDFTNVYKNQIDTNTTEIEKKVNKTSVSSANKTTSTIAITDNSQMAMVKSISGKTQKVVQQFPTSPSTNAITSKTYNNNSNEFTITASGTFSGFYLTNTQLTFGHVYYLSASFKIPKAGKVRLNTDFAISANTYTRCEKVERVSANVTFYNLEAANGDIFYIKDAMAIDLTVMFGAGNEPTTVAQVQALGILNEYIPSGSYLWSAPVESVVSRDSKGNVKTTVLVPSAVKNLPDYGLGIVQSDGTILANEVDFENGVYYHRVSSRTISSSGWWYSGSFFVITNYGKNVLNAKTSGQAAVITSKYNRDDALSADKTIRLSTDINIKDTSYTDASKFSANLSANPVTIVYELATPEVIPLSDYLRPLPVENGGTLTLVNEHNLDISNTIKYKKEV